MRRFVIVLSLLLVFMPILAAETIVQDSLRFMVHWYPQAQFAGYIAAVEMGFFSKAGIEMELLFSDGAQSPLTLLQEGEIDLCTAWLSDAMKCRTEGKPLVHVGQILQKSSLMLMCKTSSGITKPQDMNGRCISLWGGDFSLQPNAFLASNHIDASIIPQSYTIEPLLAGACDVSLAMYYNEYHKMIQAGINEDEMTTFLFSDYNLNVPEDGIYVMEEWQAQHVGQISRILDIIITGWQYARQHPEETLDMVMQYCERYHLQTNRSHQRWMLYAILDAIDMDGTLPVETWGSLSYHDYMLVGDELIHQKLISHIPDFTLFVKGKTR